MKTPSKSNLSESAFQKKVLNWLRSVPECYVVKVVRANRSGVPDLLICKNGVFVGVELKKEDGQLSPLQKIHLSEIKQSGGISMTIKPSSFIALKSLIESL